MYASGTDWCHKFDVDGYYVRITSLETGDGVSCFQKNVHVKNVKAAEDTRLASHLASPDALALVRFGLRSADDPRMRDTAKVIDALLKVDTPCGPAWHRYNDDGYGEYEDDSPFDGTGIGRGWPLLTGERGHYELAAGRVESAECLLTAIESFANEGGLISEQVWDCADIPDCDLRFGRPSGSAMPLVWAHAEYLKLRRSPQEGRIFDLPPQTVQRYLINRQNPRVWCGDTTTKFARSQPAKSCALRRWRPHSFIGAPMIGKRPKIYRHTIPDWGFILPTWPPPRLRKEIRSNSPFAGRRRTIGKARIFSSESALEWNATYEE